MLRGNWFNYAKTGGLIAVSALFVYFLVADLRAVSDSYEHHASDKSAEYAENAEREIARDCMSIPTNGDLNCVREREYAARQNQREEQDLAAQRVTAWWTAIMGVAALIGMALSAVGVFLVWTTFAETRRANSIAREALTSENRAWLKVSASINVLHIDHAMAEGTAAIEIENVGNSVARKVAFWGSIKIVGESFIIKHDFSDLPEPQIMPVDRDLNIWPRQTKNVTRSVAGLGVRLAKIRSPSFRVFARAVVEYQTIFDNPDDPVHVTEYIFEIYQPNAAFRTEQFAAENLSVLYNTITEEAASGGGRAT